MALSLVVVGCTSAACQSVRGQITLPAGIMQPPPDWQTPLNGDYFTLREEVDHYAKTTGRNL